jgi:hypothetical protein
MWLTDLELEAASFQVDTFVACKTFRQNRVLVFRYSHVKST